MTQVSRRPIHKDVYYEIRDDLVWIMSELKTKAEMRPFFYDFFTKTERLMLAKRFAVALMLQKELNYRDIRDVLHVSTSTITRMAQWLDQGGEGLKLAVGKLMREERLEAFWKKVNRLLDQISRLRK